MARYKAKMRGSVKGLISSLIGAFIMLWVGGLIVWEVAVAQLGDCGSFNKGFTILGWKVGSNATAIASNTSDLCAVYNRQIGNDVTASTSPCATNAVETSCTGSTNILYDVSNAGILVVVGLVAIAAVLLNFIKISKM